MSKWMVYYTQPTPGTQNSEPYTDLDFAKKPTFSLDSGFYNDAQTLELTQANGGLIYYTLDGSIPTKNASIYTQPISLNQTTIVRARSFESGKFMSKIKNKTYFINEHTRLPVISIGIDEKYLYDDKIGIYTVGTSQMPNYKYDWMRPGCIEYFKDSTSQFSENVGVRIYGGASRRYAQKSLSIFAKDKYGPSEIEYALFPQKPHIKAVKSFILRNSGDDDWIHTMMKDGFVHTLISENMDLDYLSYQPTIVFLNGVYWGIHNIREKPNEDYIAANHNVDRDEIDLLGNSFHAEPEVFAGEATAYTDLLDFIRSHSLTNTENYAYVASKIDIDEYQNYMILQSFIASTDWAGNNIKYWKEQSDTAKWRWILFDTDYSFKELYHDSIAHIMDTSVSNEYNPPWATYLFRSLLENETFKYKFVGRYISHLYTTFTTEKMDALISQLSITISDEIQRHHQKWTESAVNWEDKINAMYDFSDRRRGYILRYLEENLYLSGSNTLDIGLSTHGSVLLDGIKLSQTFNASYYDHTIVTLKAQPDEGYKFLKWVYNDGTENLNQEITLVLNNNITLEARFTESVPAVLPKIVINEFNYKSADEYDIGDWIELYNNDITAIDLSGWDIKDDDDTHSFIIPNNTLLNPNDYLIISENVTDFITYVPQINLIHGDMPFGLGKSDTIRIFNSEGILIDSVSYDKTWPDAKGNGKTLSLIDPNRDNALSQNWIASELYGTPGDPN